MLAILTPATASALTTAEALRSTWRSLFAEVSLESLEGYIASASQAVVEHLRLPGLGLAKYRQTETVRDIVLAATPWAGELAVTQAGMAASFAAPSSYSDPILRVTASSAFFRVDLADPGLEPYAVVYWAGYALPGQEVGDLPAEAPEGVATLPATIQRAVGLTIKAWYLADQRDESISSRNAPNPGGMASTTLTYSSPPADRGALPPEVVALLREHRR